jgi:hypothetical protein
VTCTSRVAVGRASKGTAVRGGAWGGCQAKRRVWRPPRSVQSTRRCRPLPKPRSIPVTSSPPT